MYLVPTRVLADRAMLDRSCLIMLMSVLCIGCINTGEPRYIPSVAILAIFSEAMFSTACTSKYTHGISIRTDLELQNKTKRL